jgi:hypothetical protein
MRLEVPMHTVLANREEIAAYLETLPNDLIYAESNRRLAKARRHKSPCPICGLMQESRAELRRHFQACKVAHKSNEPQTGMIGETWNGEEWEPYHAFNGETVGRRWARERPELRRVRRVMRGSGVWEAAARRNGMGAQA